MSLLLAAASTSDFDPVRENLGMAVVGVIVLVMWLLFRHMLKWSERISAAEAAASKAKKAPLPDGEDR